MFALLGDGVQALCREINGPQRNDNIPSPDREPSKDDYDWPVAPLSIDDADEQFTRLQRSHAEARDTYSLLVHERHEAAEHISMLKQEQARLPAAVFAEKMRVLLRHYETLESDVFEARDALTTAQRVKMTARSKGVAVFKRSSRSVSPVRASPIRTARTPSGDGVARGRTATQRSVSPTCGTRTTKAVSRLPSAESSQSGSSVTSSSQKLQFHRVRSSP